MVIDPFEVARITLLKLEPPEALLRRPFIPLRDEIPGDVDSSNFCPETRQWHGRSAVPTTEIQCPQRRLDPERFHHGFAGFPHEVGDRSEIAFFPECFVRIHNGLFHRLIRPRDFSARTSQGDKGSQRCFDSPHLLASSHGT